MTPGNVIRIHEIAWAIGLVSVETCFYLGTLPLMQTTPNKDVPNKDVK